MKTIFTVIITCTLILNNYAQNQGNWEILNDGLFMQWLKGIDFVNENSGWLIVERGLLKTEDGGETWSNISLPSGMSFEYIDFKSTEVGWSIGSSEENWRANIYRTEDGGLTWKLSSNLPENFNLLRMAAVNDSVIYITGEITRTDYCAGWVFKSTNAGASWNDITPGSPQNHVDFNSIYFLDPERGFVSGTCNDSLKILRTFNGGINWEEKLLDFDELNQAQFLNDSTLYFLAHDREAHYLCSTNDMFDSWTVLSENDLEISSFYVIDKNTIFAGMRDSLWNKYIMKTTTGGNTWEKKKSLWKVGVLNSIFFITSQVGFSIVDYFHSDCSFLKTTDAGETWVLKKFTFPFHDVFFIDRNLGFAVSLWSFGHGWGGDIFFTDDGGITWNHNVDCGYVQSLLYVNDLTGYYLNNEIQKTIDQGQNWTLVYKNNPDSIGYGFYGSALDFMDENVGWAVGRGEWSDSSGVCILGADDGGENWNLAWKYPDTDVYRNTLNSIHIINAMAWAVGSSGMMVKYTAESEWQLQSSVTDLPLNNVFFSDEQHGWIAGGYIGDWDIQSILLLTKDGGMSWNEIRFDKYLINDLYFADSLHGWAVGSDTSRAENWPQRHGVILETSDGGENWVTQVEGLSASLSALHFKDGSGWAVGYNGLILRTEDGSTWIDQNTGQKYPSKYQLYQNYPNPFNPITTIVYQLPKQSHVELSVYNILGQKVVNLVDKKQSVGTYNVEWDAGGFASGIYIYRFETNGGFIKSRKLVILK